jgi:hypothetical protein
MARRRDDGLLHLLTGLPWWVSVAISVIVYVALRWLAPAIEFDNLVFKNVAKVVPQTAWFFALIFLFVAAFSFFKSWQRRHLLDSRSDLDSIRALSWSDFELLVGEAFRRQGYAVEKCGGWGIGRVLYKGGQKSWPNADIGKAKKPALQLSGNYPSTRVSGQAPSEILADSSMLTLIESISSSRNELRNYRGFRLREKVSYEVSHCIDFSYNSPRVLKACGSDYLIKCERCAAGN